MFKAEADYVRDPQSKQMKVGNPNPYMWIGQNKVEICFQKGKFYSRAGEPMERDSIPAWWWKIARESYSEEVREGHGLVLPEDVVLTKEEQQAVHEKEMLEKEQATSTCKICYKQVKNRMMGLHMEQHAREKKKKEEKGGK